MFNFIRKLGTGTMIVLAILVLIILGLILSAFITISGKLIKYFCIGLVAIIVISFIFSSKKK